MVNSKCAIVSRGASASSVNLRNGTVKGKADDLYCGSMQSEDHRRTALQYPLVHWILCRCQQYGAFEHEGLRKQNDVLGLCPVEGRAYRRLRVTDVDEYRGRLSLSLSLAG